MAGEIGKIISLNGSFFIKHPNGSVSTAKVNDVLNDGDIIIGSSSNTNSNMLKVLLSDNSGDIQVVGNNEQLFDVTLLSGELPEDTVVQNSEVSDLLEQSTRNIQENPTQTDEQATLTLDQIEKLDAAAAGGDQPATDATGIIPLRLEDRTAGETNITTDLRDAVSTATVVDDTVATNNTILVDATLTLVDTAVLEGNGNATLSGSLDQTPRTTLIVTLSNGATITFGTDYVPGTLVESTPFPIQGDDVYIDAEAYTVSGTSYVGGGFNSIVGYPSTVTVSDTIDVTTVSVTTADVNENAELVTFNFETSNVPQVDIPASLTITLNGIEQTVTLDADGKGSLTVDTKDSDVYNDSQIYEVIVTSINGGNFEATDVSGAKAVANVTDIGAIDTVIAKLEAVENSDSENGYSVTYKVVLEDSSGNPVNVQAGQSVTVDVNVTDGNNDGTDSTNPLSHTFIINGGSSESATWTYTHIDADPYVESESISAVIDVTSVTTNEGNFENLTADTTVITTPLVDVPDTVIAKLEAVENSDSENGYSVTYKVVLEDSSGNPVNVQAGQSVTVDVNVTDGNNDGTDSTNPLSHTFIINGGSSESATWTYTHIDADPYVESESISAVIDVTSVTTNEGNFENLTADTTVITTPLVDVPDTVIAKLEAVENSDSENGYSVTYKVVLEDSSGNPVNVQAGQSVTVDVNVTDGNNDGTDSTNPLSHTFIINGGSSESATWTYTHIDADPYVESESISAVIDVTSVTTNEGNFENLTADTTVITTPLVDVPDTVIAKLEAVENSDSENGYSVTYKVVLEDSSGNPVNVQAGQSVTVDVNVTDGNNDGTDSTNPLSHTFIINGGSSESATWTYTHIDADPYVESESISAVIDVTSVTTNEGNFENLTADTTVITTPLVDVPDTVIAKLEAVENSDSENGYSVTYKVVLEDSSGNPVNVQAGQSVTVDVNVTDGNNDGTDSTNPLSHTFIINGGSSESATWTYTHIDADPYVESESISAVIDVTSVTTNEGNFENLTADTTVITTPLVDVPDTVIAKLEAVENSDSENGYSVTYKVVLEDSSGNPVNVQAGQSVTVDVNVTDGNNDGTDSTNPLSHTFIINGGSSESATWTYTHIDADPYVESESISAVIDVTSVTTNEGNFENLTADTTVITTPLVDVPDTTILKVNESLNTDGSYTYTAIVSNAPDSGDNLVITLDNGKTIILDSSVTTASVNSDIQASAVISVTGGNYEDLKVIYGFGQDLTTVISPNNEISGIDINTSYFDSDTINTEISLSSIKLTPRVDSDGFAININGEKLTSTDNIGTTSATTYYIKYLIDSTTNEVNAVRTDSSGTIISPEQVVFTIVPDVTNESYSLSLGTYPLDGSSYTLENIFDSSGALGGGNAHSLLFNLNDLYVLATTTNSSGDAGITKNNGTFDPYTVNYSSGNGMGIEGGNSINTDEILYLNFTNSSIYDQMSGDLLVDTDQNNDSKINSIDNREYARDNEQYLTQAIFGLKKWDSGDQAVWKAYNGDVLIAEGIKDYTSSLDKIIISSEVSNISITNASSISWNILDNILTNNDSSEETANITYSLDNGATFISTSITLGAGEIFNFDQFNEIQITAGTGDFSVASMNAISDESIPAENQIINVDVETSNGTDTTTGIMQITFDGDGVIVGTDQDDVIDFTATTSINGEDGIDTLVLSGNESIDFSSIPDNSIVSIEHIDLTANGSQSVTNLTLADVVDLVPNISGITDTATNISSTDHLLKITGSNEDSALFDTTESWTKASSSYTDADSIVYDVFSNNEDSSYKVLIQQDVQETITNP